MRCAVCELLLHLHTQSRSAAAYVSVCLCVCVCVRFFCYNTDALISHSLQSNTRAHNHSHSRVCMCDSMYCRFRENTHSHTRVPLSSRTLARVLRLTVELRSECTSELKRVARRIAVLCAAADPTESNSWGFGRTHTRTRTHTHTRACGAGLRVTVADAFLTETRARSRSITTAYASVNSEQLMVAELSFINTPARARCMLFVQSWLSMAGRGVGDWWVGVCVCGLV